MTSYAVIGTGAIGGYYGARLAEAGRDVYFLFRSDANHVRENGLVVKSPDGDIHLREVKAAATWDEIPPVDVVIVAVKATANDDIAPRLRSILKPGGIVLLIQNGINAEVLMQAAVGEDITVVGAAAFISAEQTGRNVVEHFANGMLNIGQFAPDYLAVGVSDALQALNDDLVAGGLSIQLDADLLQSRWQKLVWNIPFNALCVILNTTTTGLINSEVGAALVGSMMDEVLQAAAADGREIPQDYVEMLLAGTRLMDSYSPSMKVDSDAGRRLEVDALLGAALRRAEDNGVQLPTIKAVHRQLVFIDERLAAEAV